MTSPIARHRTALHRSELSRPIKLALDDHLIKPGIELLDYGCGHGGDVRQLQGLGFCCTGWDPVHRPDGARREVDVVNIGYVVNVIEDELERADTLRSAWSCARDVLIVAARLAAEAKAIPSQEFADGYVTRCGTFQKLYGQQELRDWIERVLEARAVTAGPGVFYVFRDEAKRQSFLFSRYQRRPAAPRVDRSEAQYAANRELLDGLVAFLAARGRVPDDAELGIAAEQLHGVFGSVRRAVAVVTRALGTEQWKSAQDDRTQDLLVYLALARFDGRPKFSQLPRDLKLDIRAFFTSYQAACDLADATLLSVGNVRALDPVFRDAPVGKLMPTALYVHMSALPLLPPPLRIYEGCARGYCGAIDDANLVKLHRDEPKVSYLVYPQFDEDPHPSLLRSIVVPLQTFRLDVRDYSCSPNPPILHHKEEFVGAEYAQRKKFQRLSEQEERFGLYAAPERIGTRNGWEQVLRDRGMRLRGHRVVRVTQDAV